MPAAHPGALLPVLLITLGLALAGALVVAFLDRRLAGRKPRSAVRRPETPREYRKAA